MTEKELAYAICRCHAKTIVDECGGITLDGISLSEKYAEMWKGFRTFDCQMALIHWVYAVGYDSNGKFEIIISNSILNC